MCGNEELLTILGVVRTAIKFIQFGIPIVLIVLVIVDFAKAVASNDEKATKEAQKKSITRVIYAIVIFLVPTIVTLIFNLLPSNVFGGDMGGYTWKDCWKAAGK